ncbi:MAG TPA: peptidase E [Candidatus Acidoferrales bacterium]|nr:peptidase E [Candidatus Acidoferrales bacterium]
MRRPKTIIAIGGGGFSTIKPDPKLDRYILGLTGRKAPRICFVATASGDDEHFIAKFKVQARRLGARPSHLSVFKLPVGSVRDFLLAHDVIYVCGGNTRNLLILWKAWGLDAIMRAAYERGVVLAGHSAGGLCWFGGGVTDSWPGRYAPLRCLGFLRGSFCPHYDSEPKRRPVYRALVRSKKLPGGYAADDHVALCFRNGVFVEAVTSRRKARAYRLAADGGKVREQKIVPRLLGGRVHP